LVNAVSIQEGQCYVFDACGIGRGIAADLAVLHPACPWNVSRRLLLNHATQRRPDRSLAISGDDRIGNPKAQHEIGDRRMVGEWSAEQHDGSALSQRLAEGSCEVRCDGVKREAHHTGVFQTEQCLLYLSTDPCGKGTVRVVWKEHFAQQMKIRQVTHVPCGAGEAKDQFLVEIGARPMVLFRKIVESRLKSVEA